jgi:hypothetical protein
MRGLLVTTLILAIVPAALADPSQSVRGLMADRVSMLDWGLEHIERDLQGAWGGQGATRELAESPTSVPTITVDYDYAGDNIVVSVLYGAHERPGNEQICRRIITFLRDRLDPHGPDGKRRRDAHLWLVYFFHTGTGQTDSAPEWKALERTIPPLILLKVSVYSEVERECKCSARLTSDSMTFDR